MFSTTIAPCFVRISASIFLGISKVPVIQNDCPDNFPSITFFLRSNSQKLTPCVLNSSNIFLLSSFENHVLNAIIVSAPIHLIDKRNSSSVSRRSRSSIEKSFFSLYHLADIASTMICAVFFQICWMPKPFITRRRALFFDFFNSSAIS